MIKDECKIIQDLLPSYVDKIASEETNNLVNEHLKTCKECSKKIDYMNKEVNVIDALDQKEELEYLKGFKRRKRLLVIFSILVTICIGVGIFFIRVPLSVDKFNLEWMYIDAKTGINETTGETWEYNTLDFYLSTEYDNIVVTGSSISKYGEDKEIIIKLSGGLPNGISGGDYGIYSQRILHDDTEKIYIQGAFGKKKLIWSKDMNTQTKEEWENWYTEEYIPSELDDVYGIYYKNEKNKTEWIPTKEWRMLYNKYFNK